MPINLIPEPVTVGELIQLLEKLPPETEIFTSGMEGIFPAELGNLFPIKVLQTHKSVSLYIDDGIGDHEEISEAWQPLDEYVHASDRVMQ